MIKQTKEQMNEKRRARYHLPGNLERNHDHNQRRNKPPVGLNTPCRPFQGLKFNSKAVQNRLVNWGGFESLNS